MHDVADKVGDLGTIGAIAAAIAALALSCRMRGAKLDERPPAFPKDGNAELKKYENAYLQLSRKSAQMEAGDRTSYDTAGEHALRAFEIAQGIDSAAAQAVTPVPKPVLMDMAKPSKTKLKNTPDPASLKGKVKSDKGDH